MPGGAQVQSVITLPAGLQCWLRPGQQPGTSYPCRLAGRILVADATVAPLAPFVIGESAALLQDRRPLLTGSGKFVCRSTGWIADVWREVDVWRHQQGLRLQIAGVGEFAVTADAISVTALEPAVTDAAMAETLLGPPMALALALQGVWCLHASAVTVDGQVIAFAGESGNGKSTLAAYLNAAEEGGWRRLADDTLPVSLGPNGLVALPHFPQHKLPEAGQYPVNAPTHLSLAAVYVLAPPGGADAVSLRRLDPRQAMQALIRHTVAARLFDKSLLAAHLDFCAETAARIPVWRLAYPHQRENLPQVRVTIQRSLSECVARR